MRIPIDLSNVAFLSDLTSIAGSELSAAVGVGRRPRAGRATGEAW